MASQTERNYSTIFLKSAADVLGWKSLNQDLVIDIGCGDGRTARAIVDAFPEVRKVVAIDILEQRLNKAERKHPDRKIVYERADIRHKLSIARWVGQMDKAVSVFCFNCVDDVRVGYENMFCLLKTGGEAAILQSLQSGYYDFLTEIKDSPKWRNYFKGTKVAMPASHFEKHSGDHYKKMLVEVGFEVVDCFEEGNAYSRSFSTDEECKNVIFNCCQLTSLVPEDKRAEFIEDSFQVYIKYTKRDGQGHPMLEHNVFSAFLRKPKTDPQVGMNVKGPV